MGFKAIVFDLDGTLLNTLEDIADASNSAFRQLGCPEHPLEAYKILVGDGVESLVRRGLPPDRCDPATIAQCGALMKQAYSKGWDRKSRPYDEVPAMLDALTAHGVPMTVLSNKPDEFAKLCVARLLGKWRFAVVAGESARLPKKPDPAGAQEIACQLGIPPSEIAYIGDTNTDMQTAVAAGMYPVGVLWGFRTREELLSSGARVLLQRPLEVVDVVCGA